MLKIAPINELTQLINNKEMLSVPEELADWLNNLTGYPEEVTLNMDCPGAYRLQHKYANLESMRGVPSAAVLTLILKQEEEWKTQGSYFGSSYLCHCNEAFFAIITSDSAKKVVRLSHSTSRRMLEGGPAWHLSIVDHTDDEYEELHDRFYESAS